MRERTAGLNASPNTLVPVYAVAIFLKERCVCNLYSLNRGQAAIRALFDRVADHAGNLPPLPAIYPDQAAPIVREGAEGRELVMGRWGMPSPKFALSKSGADRGVTNVRNTKSSHWRRWLGPENRCLVPFTSFSEFDAAHRKPVWFSLGEDQPISFFAGIWTTWTSLRKVKDGETTDELFAFLTTEANGVVRPIHPKAMPVILTTLEEWETWLCAPWAEAAELQRPLPDDRLAVISRSED